MNKLILAAALTLAATAAQAQGVNQNGHPAQGTGGVAPRQQTSPNNTPHDNNNGTSNVKPSTGGTRNPKN
jgi:hypothetical protein